MKHITNQVTNWNKTTANLVCTVCVHHIVNYIFSVASYSVTDLSSVQQAVKVGSMG